MNKNLITKVMISFGIIIAFIMVLSVSWAASISMLAGNTNLTVGSTTTITIRGNDIVGKIGISSSNPGVVSISKTTDWLEGTVTVKATAKSPGTARIIVTSIDTASLSTGAAISTSAGITINSKNAIVDTRSSNNNLSSLQIEGVQISPEFNASNITYTANVSFDVTSLNVLAVPADNRSTTAVSGNMDLVTGENNISIVVTAENGVKKTYTIVVTKAKNPDDLDTHLKNLLVSNATLRDIFDGDKLEYICDDIYADVDKLDIVAEPKIEGATVEILGNENLNIGTNVITIKVVSKDGSTSREYKLLVYKLNETLALKDIDDTEISFKSINGIVNIIKKNIVQSILILIIIILVIFNIILFCRKLKYKRIVKSKNKDIEKSDVDYEKNDEEELEENIEKADSNNLNNDSTKRRRNRKDDTNKEEINE